MWLPSNFRLTLGALPTAKVNKVDAFTVKQNFVETPDGQGGVTLEPTNLEFPNLAVTLPESQRLVRTCSDDFVIEGNSRDDKELTGQLEFLVARSLDGPSSGWACAHLGIFALRPGGFPSRTPTRHSERHRRAVLRADDLRVPALARLAPPRAEPATPSLAEPPRTCYHMRRQGAKEA